MTALEWIGAGMIALLTVETAVWTFWPDRLLALADFLYKRPVLNHLIHGAGAVAVLVLLLNHLTAVEIVAVSLFVGLLSGMIVTPFGRRGVDVVRSTLRERRVWPHMIVPWSIMTILVIWAVFDLLN